MNNNADDINLIETKRNSLHLLQEQGKRSGIVINKAKTQTMVFGTDNIDKPVKVVDWSLDNVTLFTYLGTVFT